MCKTIVITTTEQANAMLEALDRCQEAARVDDYATERKRPIKWMTCTCCGESYRGRQWWNQDCGYGLGDCCVQRCGADPTIGVESSCYGVSGIHFLIPADEPETVDPMVGSCLHGVDERLRWTCDGYVYWKGVVIEHWEGSLTRINEESLAEARELIRRCEILEARGETPNSTSVIWTWQD